MTRKNKAILASILVVTIGAVASWWILHGDDFSPLDPTRPQAFENMSLVIDSKTPLLPGETPPNPTIYSLSHILDSTPPLRISRECQTQLAKEIRTVTNNNFPLDNEHARYLSVLKQSSSWATVSSDEGHVDSRTGIPIAKASFSAESENTDLTLAFSVSEVNVTTAFENDCIHVGNAAGTYTYPARFLIGGIVVVAVKSRRLDGKASAGGTRTEVKLSSGRMRYLQYGDGTPDLDEIKRQLKREDPAKMLEELKTSIKSHTVIGVATKSVIVK